ncbi:MAG: aspartate aminotransferase family protein [bacterium]|nr:aspartate aminotransferase family protein [bacterium]
MYLVRPFSEPGNPEATVCIVSGRGCLVRDDGGREYLDANAGLWLVNAGYGRPELLAAATRQLEDLAYFPVFWGFTNPPALRLASRLAELMPGGPGRVLFTTGGAEAVETAIKVARRYHFLRGEPERTGIIARHRAYHGLTGTALAAGGFPAYKEGFGPPDPDFSHIPPPYCYRCPWEQAKDCCGLECAHALEAELRRRGPERVAAFVAEPVAGVGGVLVPPQGYLPAVQEICRRYGVLFIADEIITGFGRTGRLFGVNHWGVEPDLMCLAKGLTSGYLPLGACLISEAVWKPFAESPSAFRHGYTYSGHAAACAVGLRNLELILDEDLPGRSARLGEYLLNSLSALDHPAVGEVRGLGLMVGLELVADRATRQPFDPKRWVGWELQEACRREGVLLRSLGDIISLSPPLVITEEQIDLVVAVLDRCLRTEVDGKGLS